MEIKEDFYFFTPTTISITGSTGSGKSFFMYQLLKNADDLLRPKTRNLILLYSQYQEIYDQIKLLDNFDTIKIEQGLNVNFEEIEDAVIVIDDQMREIMRDE